jgi:uncharacterized pyridoxamine 5'-phosphate oxidase family protein
MKKSIIIIFSILLALNINAYGQVQFSESKNVHSLNLENRTDSYTKGTHSKTVSLEIELSDVELFKTGQNFELFKIEGLSTTGNAGEPTTYIKPVKVVLEKDARVTGVRLTEGNYVEIQQEINLAPRGKPVVWTKGAQNDFTLKKDETVYGRDVLFPGKTISCLSGQDGQNTVVYIQLYAVQYNPVKKQTVLIKNADIEISYVIEPKTQIKKSGMSTNATNIIITTSAFKQYADSLKNMHETLANVTTEVITIETIEANYTSAEDPTLPGYANTASSDVIVNYNYDLSKKIISYLRDNAAHPNLESITILGDADKVPPSNYFYIFHFLDNYNNWICSDLFYASPDYDMVLNYEVGRLPADSEAEAELMVQKLINWKTNLDASWFNNVQLVGGMPFNNKTLIGEVITLDVVNKGYLKGMNINKNYFSKGTENPGTVLPYFSDENTGIIYHNGHGGGNAMYLGNDYLLTSDLTNLPPKQKYPVVVSIACMNGGYDTELMIDAPSSVRCFAEGVIGSQAGGIAYWGGVRSNYGAPERFFKDNGEMVVGDEPQMAGMLTNLFKAWSEGNTRFGAISNQAYSDYVLNTGLADIYDTVTYYEFVFFGDPALSILPQASNSYDNVDFYVNPPPDMHGDGWREPIYYKTSDVSIPLNIGGNTNSPEIKADICGVVKGGATYFVNNLLNTTISSPPFEYEFTPTDEKIYFAAYETADFKETRLYFRTKTVNQLPPVPAYLSEVQNQNGNNYDLLWTSAKDYDGQVVSYTLFEGKNPTVVYDSCNNLEKWDNTGFTVSAGGHNSANCFYSGSGSNHEEIRVSITTTEPVLVQPDDTLSFWKKYEIESQYDFAYVEIAEPGQRFIQLESYTDANNTWTQSKIDLSDYAGKKVLIRFNYITDDMINKEGFYVDDIKPVGWFEEAKFTENLTNTTYTVTNNQSGDYYYRVKAVDNDNLESFWSNRQNIDFVLGIKDNSGVEDISLLQNYPNPFKGETTINFGLKNQTKVTIEVFNITGQKVKTLLNKKMLAGKHEINWNGCNETGALLPNGFYFYKLETGIHSQTRKMLLMK